jgi:hypothetical protein
MFTWTTKGTKSVTDYIMIKLKLNFHMLDTCAFRGPEALTDNFLVQYKTWLPQRYIKIKKIDMLHWAAISNIQFLEQERINKFY